jgi:hypothetical protein
MADAASLLVDVHHEARGHMWALASMASLAVDDRERQALLEAYGMELARKDCAGHLLGEVWGLRLGDESRASGAGP